MNKWTTRKDGSHVLWLGGTIPLSIEKNKYKRFWMGKIGDIDVEYFKTLNEAKVGLIDSVLKAIEEVKNNQ